MQTKTKRTKPHKRPPPGSELLRTSERGALNKCRQRWAWGYVDLLHPIRNTPALRFGRLIHRALEHYYDPRHSKPEHPAATFLRLYEQELDETLKDWPNWRDEDDEWHTYRELGEAMLTGYVDKWHEQDKEYIVVAVEQRFQTKIRVPKGAAPLVPPSPTFYVGTFDRVLYHLPSRRLLFGDYKTTKNDPTKNPHLELDEQAGAYWAYGPTWITHEAPPSVRKQINDAVAHLPRAHRDAAKSLHFDGILYDFLKKSLPDDRSVNAQGYALNNDGTVSKRQPGPLFHRETVFRDEGDRRNVLRRIYEDAKEIGMMRRGELTVKKSPDRFICIGCPYIDMCVLHETGADWTAYREACYEDWNPYDTYEIDADELQ